MGYFLFVFQFLALVSLIYAQEGRTVTTFRGTQGPLSGTMSHILKGASRSFEWYDVPIAAAYGLRSSIRPEYNNRLIVRPFHFEEELQEHVGVSGRYSIGSMDKDLIPYSVFFAGLAYTAGADILTNANINDEDYQRLFVFYKSLIYTHTATELVKNFTRKDRPDGTDGKSFFSGHSSTTFAAVSFIYREVDDFIDRGTISRNSSTKFLMKSLSFTALYGWASFVAYSRLRDNKHYLMDVATGAAVGTLIGNMLYSKYFSSPSDSFNFSMGVSDNTPHLNFSYSF